MLSLRSSIRIVLISLALIRAGLPLPVLAEPIDTARAAAAGFGGLCATRTPSAAHLGCARIAIAIAGAPDTDAAARLARAVDRLMYPLGASASASESADATTDAQALAAVITALALDLQPDLSAFASTLGPIPEPNDPVVESAQLHPGAIRDPLAQSPFAGSAVPSNAPRDPHAGYALQPLLPPEARGAARVDGGRPDPLAAYKAQMAEELGRQGLPVPPEFQPMAAEDRGLGTRACAAFGSSAFGGSPLGFADLPMPTEIAGLPGSLHAVLLMGGVAVPVPLLRSDSGLRLGVPFHLDDWRSGGVAALVVYHALAMQQNGLACAPVPFRIDAAEIVPGAFGRAATAMAALPDRMDGLSRELPLPAGAAASLADALAGGLAPLQEAYEEGDAALQDILDALAPSLLPAPVVSALTALNETLPVAPGGPQRDGRFERMGARIVPAQADPGRGISPTGGRVCPADATELAAWSDLHLHMEIASSPEMQNILTASQILAGASIGLAVSAATPAAAAAGTRGASALVTNAPGAMLGLAYSTYGIYIDYLDKTLPSRATALRARVDREVFSEADPDPVATLLEAVLVTESKGWDPSKAVVDILTGMAGFLGVEGRATAATRSVLEIQYARQIARLTDKLMPTTRAQRDLVAAGFAFDRVGAAATAADTAENLVGSFLGWFGGDRASGPLRDTLGFAVVPQTCRTSILEEGFVEVKLRQGLPDSFALEGGPPYQARALQWGDADLLVYPGTPLWRLREADASIRLTTPRTQILLGLPAELQPGDAATLTAQTAPLVADADFGWDFDSGVVSARRNRDGSEIAIATSRNARDFPVVGTATLDAPHLMPPRAPGERMRRFIIGATRLGLRPEKICAEPGDDVRIVAFDGETGAPVDPRTLVFRTIGGGRVLADGTLTDIPPGRTPIIVRARGVGANGYAGETEIARGCACGTSFFDPALVASGPLRAGGVETFALRGRWSWSTSGDYEVSGETGETAIRLGAYDHTFLAGNTMQMHATCAYQVAGLSVGMIPFETYFSREGPLVVLQAWPDGASPTQAAIATGGIEIAGEDRDGDGRIDPSRNANDALRFTPTGPALVQVERLARNRLVITVSTPMEGRGDKVVGRRPTGQAIEEQIDRRIIYHARFETSGVD